MTDVRDIALIDELCALSAETEWVEFKHNNADAKMIGTRCSALANSARLCGKDKAYIVWGVEDGSHDVIGTNFDPEIETVGKIPLKLWLSQRFKPDLVLVFKSIEHTNGPCRVAGGACGGNCASDIREYPIYSYGVCHTEAA